MADLNLTEQEQTDLAFRLCRELDYSEEAKGDLPIRWKKNEALYNGDPKATNLTLVDGMQGYPIPLVGPKVDRICATSFKGSTSMDPYVQVKTADGQLQKADDLEDTLMVLAGKGRRSDVFDRCLKQCLPITANCGVSQMYVYTDPETWDVIHKAIHPTDFMIYPHEAGSISRAKSVGHRFQLMKSEITERFTAGEYITDDVNTTSVSDKEASKSKSFAKTEATNPVTPEDKLIELWQIVTTYKQGETSQRVVCVIAPNDKKLLMIASLPYLKGPYFDFRFEDTYGSYWPARSVVQNIQALQLAYTDCFNVMIQGSYAAAFPVIVVTGGTLTSKVLKYGPGTMLEAPQGFVAQTLGAQFNPGAIPQMIDRLEAVTDAVSGISQLGTTQNLPSGTTATAANGLLQAQDEAKDSYTDAIAPTIAEIWEFYSEMLALHYNQFKAKYQDQIRCDPETLAKPYLYEPTGKTATASPNALLNKLQTLYQMAMNPESGLDLREVETQIIEVMNLPLDPQSLEKQDAAQQLFTLIGQSLEQGAQPQQIQEMVMQAMQMLAQQAMQQPGKQPPNDGMGGVPAQLPQQPKGPMVGANR